ncbi:sensor histidine kinase [Daejeonella oryzae]|uniref:sensor histidine kinase n=1 Tax=Daejeonella oryzae TaxID=1122943 RepID=UPI00041E4728|nr:HAMP domain-containing sensor histidine kinase [Daejeonella oryzae]
MRLSEALKIRIFLFVLTLGFAFTALTLNYTFKKEEILSLDGQQIQQRLQQKEKFIKNFLNDPAVFDSLKNIHRNEEWAQKLIPEFAGRHKIYIHTYKNGKLLFWGGNRILFDSDSSIREGSTFLSWENGEYEIIKKTEGEFSVLACIPIKSDYPYQNQYLQNTFSDDLIKENNLDIASINDRGVYNIRNLEGKYLFSVKLKPSALNVYYSSFELWMWILTVVFGLIFINHLSNWIAGRGHVKTSIAFLAFFLLGFRLLDLSSPWFQNHFDIEIFNPKYYAASYLSPSIGGLLLNVLSFTWLIAYIYSYRFRIIFSREPAGRILSFVIIIIVAILLCGYAVLVDNLFYGLVSNSKINFDVSNVLNLNWVSWLGILIFCFASLSLYLLINSVFVLADTLNINHTERLILFLSALLIAALYNTLPGKFSIYFLLFGAILFISGWAYYHNKKLFNAGMFIGAILIFSIIASLKLSEYDYLKEHESRKLLVSKIISSDDPNAVLLFLDLEKKISKDSAVVDYYNNPIANHAPLLNRLQKIYFSGYLSRYEFKCYEFNRGENLFRGDSNVYLSNFKSLVLAGSVKISDYFYRVNNTFGFQKYFALLPINQNNKNLGTLVIELKSKPLNEMGEFPELLIDGKIKENLQSKNYSYAFYNDGRLLNQHGKYIYNLANYDFSGKIRDFVFVNKVNLNGVKYSHLVYRPTQSKLVIISKEIKGLLPQLASVSFIFLILLLFAFLVFLFKWIWFSFINYDIRFSNLRWNTLFYPGRMLYKTRIQVSMVSAVVLTLLITGIITFYNISNQYREQQEQSILDKVNKMARGFDMALFRNGVLMANEQAEMALNTFADLNGSDLNLFDTSGNLMMTTQPKIYENNLIARKLNPLAYVYLNKLQKAEFINEEEIGRLNFITAYVPLRNTKNEAIAYLGLPYFSNESDYEERIGIFINALLNIYALVFMAIGFFAVFVANRITNPLTLIQKSLSETQIGRRNEPIIWKRNDEIGNLIREYNNMISALDDSTQKLARSERETAWREMAKQVAHEIKNPLTPLKLGVQLLEKSWKEKDPNFDKKFERFSKSFVEQIESLAHIASEFSNFAKMPDTVLEDVYLSEIIQQSVELYRHSEHTTIIINDSITPGTFVKGDKDQLLRCFNNLIKNSIEARPEIRRGVIKIKLYNTAKNAFLEIHDNGSGIPDNLRSRIFTPNFTTKSSGTGLGLAFVKQALVNMGGNISYKTEQDIGTTFYINIPLAFD